MKYKPEEDGITHINIYSKGKTSLGRWLSNFSKVNLVLYEDGEFSSIESYWYWLIAKKQGYKDIKDLSYLRTLTGYQAKEFGRKITNKIDWCESDEFKYKIKQALKSKILGPAGKLFIKEFEDSILPFTHYYNYNGKVVEPNKGQWLIVYIESLRKEQKQFKFSCKI